MVGANDERVASYDQGRRLGPLGFALAWLPLLALGYVGLVATIVDLAVAGEPSRDRVIALPVAIALLVASVVLRLVLVPPRLRDLGRPSWDAFWSVIPVADLALTLPFLGRAPQPEARARRVRAWISQIGPFEAWARGLSWASRTLVVGLVTSALAALVAGGGGEWFRDRVIGRASAGGADGVIQGLFGTLVVLVLYTVLQLPKRRRVSRVSWVPTLFVLPTLLVLLAFTFAPSAGQGAGAALLMLFEIAWLVGVGSIVGGVVATFWIVSALAQHEQRKLPAGELLSASWRHMGDVVVAWGARNQIVQIGMQVVVPGIWYAISFAFSDIVVVVHPERPMLPGSTELTRGIRSKVFTMLAIGAIAQVVVTAIVSLSFLTPEIAVAAVFDASLMPLSAVLIGDFLGWAIAWVTTLALMVVFFERDALLARKQARDRGEGTQDGGAVDPAPPQLP